MKQIIIFARETLMRQNEIFNLRKSHINFAKRTALVEETKNSSGGFTEALVKWNAGHAFANTTGI